jgi:hypothetical protein
VCVCVSFFVVYLGNLGNLARKGKQDKEWLVTNLVTSKLPSGNLGLQLKGNITEDTSFLLVCFCFQLKLLPYIYVW